MTSATYISSKLDERRRTLGMPLNELSRRANVSLSTARRVLAGNAVGFEAVTAIGDAMGVFRLDFNHAQPPDEMRYLQAARNARKLVGMAQGTSALEGQAVSDEYRKLMIQKTISELLSGPRSQLWTSI